MCELPKTWYEPDRIKGIMLTRLLNRMVLDVVISQAKDPQLKAVPWICRTLIGNSKIDTICFN